MYPWNQTRQWILSLDKFLVRWQKVSAEHHGSTDFSDWCSTFRSDDSLRSAAAGRMHGRMFEKWLQKCKYRLQSMLLHPYWIFFTSLDCERVQRSLWPKPVDKTGIERNHRSDLPRRRCICDRGVGQPENEFKRWIVFGEIPRKWQSTGAGENAAREYEANLFSFFRVRIDRRSCISNRAIQSEWKLRIWGRTQVTVSQWTSSMRWERTADCPSRSRFVLSRVTRIVRK